MSLNKHHGKCFVFRGVHEARRLAHDRKRIVDKAHQRHRVIEPALVDLRLELVAHWSLSQQFIAVAFSSETTFVKGGNACSEVLALHITANGNNELLTLHLWSALLGHPIEV